MLVKVILHSADIGSAVRPFHINDILSKRVQSEFHQLADKESSLGIPVTFSVDSRNPVMCAQVGAEEQRLRVGRRGLGCLPLLVCRYAQARA